jgi:hypothetical protein
VAWFRVQICLRKRKCRTLPSADTRILGNYYFRIFILRETREEIELKGSLGCSIANIDVGDGDALLLVAADDKMRVR